MLKRHPHFLQLVPSRFNFFFVFGGLYSPLISQCNVSIGFIRLDISIDIVNPYIASCRRTQLSKSSRTSHLSFVKKNYAVLTSLSRNLETSECLNDNKTLESTSRDQRGFMCKSGLHHYHYDNNL